MTPNRGSIHGRPNHDPPKVSELAPPHRPPGGGLHPPPPTFCLVAAARRVTHSAVGLPEPLKGRRETPLSHSICRLIVVSGRPLAVEDTRQDEQLKDHPAVTELGVAAYAASPLVTADGHVVGTLAVMDFA